MSQIFLVIFFIIGVLGVCSSSVVLEVKTVSANSSNLIDTEQDNPSSALDSDDSVLNRHINFFFSAKPSLSVTWYQHADLINAYSLWLIRAPPAMNT